MVGPLLCMDLRVKHCVFNDSLVFRKRIEVQFLKTFNFWVRVVHKTPLETKR